MKTLKFLCVLALTMFTIPTLGQDFLNVYFKDGTFKIFHFETIVQLNTSQFDAEGVRHSDYQYQHVVTTYDHFVYDINDIDSIAFTKYNKQVVEDNYKEAMITILPELYQCETSEDAKNILDKINQSKGVETAWIEGDELFVKIKDWKTISFLFNNNIGEPNEIAINNFKAKLASIKPNAQKLKKPNGQPYKAIIANTQHHDESKWRADQRNNYMYPLKEKLQEMGYEAEYIPNDNKEVDLEFFTNDIYDYDVIFLSTHGGYRSNKVHTLFTSITFGKSQIIKSENFDNTDWPTEAQRAVYESQFEEYMKNPEYSSLKDDTYLTYSKEYQYSNGTLTQYWVSFVGITEDIFKKHATNNFVNPNSIFFNGACVSLKDNYSLADKLITDRKLGTYLGYTESNYYGQEAGCTFFVDMLKGLSAEKAYNNLGEFDLGVHYKEIHDSSTDCTGTYKDEDIIKYETINKVKTETKRYTASVKLLPENNEKAASRFILPTYTIKINEEEANKELHEKGIVTLKGITTAGDDFDNNITLGFRYGLNPLTLVQNTNTENYTIIPNDTRGNREFSAEISGINPNEEYTYYYRAYTYDGLHYNYGETFNFTIHKAINNNATVNISNVTVTKATYYPDHYDFNGGKYSFKYNCTVTASIDPNGRQIQEWGYVYVDPSGSTAKIPLTEFGTSYSDSRYSYCLNTSSGTLTFYGYVKYADDPNYYYEEPQQFAIAYPEGSTLNMSECTFKGTETNVSYQGKNYKYKTAYRYVFKPTGAYWLKVGTYEYGSGWNNWTNLPNYTVSPVDGNNALTVNYYYDDKTFTGDYNVKLKGDDETHDNHYTTPQYVNYTYSGSQFTGCNFHNTSNAQAPNLGPVIVDEEEEVYETVIDIVL